MTKKYFYACASPQHGHGLIMTKRTLLVSFLCVSLLGLQAQVVENIPLLTVEGEAIVKAIPDQAIITVRVHKRIGVENLTLVSDAFLFSKEQTDIKFVGNNDTEVLTSVLEATVNEKEAVFVKEFIITIHNMNDLTKVLIELLRHGFTNIHSVRYRLSDVNRLKDKARTDAIANARASAMVYARELGQGIGKAHLVKEEETQITNWYIDKFRPDINELVGTTYRLNPGYITIPCKVIVSFDLL